jgi:hypothetical protein
MTNQCSITNFVRGFSGFVLCRSFVIRASSFSLRGSITDPGYDAVQRRRRPNEYPR